MVPRLVLILVSLALLAGCIPTRVVVETQEVFIPVPEKREPPPELLESYRPAELPEWVAPHAQATSCLTPLGEQRLRELLIQMRIRIQSWEEWAK